MKIGVIGAGNMGTAMIKGWIKAGQKQYWRYESRKPTSHCILR